MAVLYGPEFHPPPGKTSAPAELPLLVPTNRHSHFVFNHKDTVRWGNYTWHCVSAAARCCWCLPVPVFASAASAGPVLCLVPARLPTLCSCWLVRPLR